MNILSKCRKVRISAQKMRLIINLVIGRKVILALTILSNINKKSAIILKKILLSAIANADHNYGLNKEKLKISKILVDNGTTMKRIMPRAKGRTDRILKRTSNITVVLSEILSRGEINGPKSSS